MKTTSRRICGAVVGLGVLSAIVPGVGADDATDHANQLAQAQRERDEWYRQQAQAQAERDEWYRQQAQAQKEREQAERDQKERDEWYRYQEQVQRDYQQSILDGIERVKQQRDEILNKAYDDHPWARAGWTAGAEWTAGGWVLPESVATPPKAPVARPMPAPQVRLPMAPPRRNVPLNPVAFRQMVLQQQAQVRQQIMQTRQQMLPGRQASPQLILNPFVASSGRQELEQQFIQNPFVGPKP